MCITYVPDFVYISISKSSNDFCTNISKYTGVNKYQVNGTQNTNNFLVLSLQCTTPHTALLAVQNDVHICFDDGLAVLTIQFPQNFNESRYVAFSTFALGLTWIAFILTYVDTEAKYQSAVTLLAIRLSSLAVIVCLFGPRVFIMMVWPSQNVITATTSITSTSNGPLQNNGSIIKLPPFSNMQKSSDVVADIEETEI